MISEMKNYLFTDYATKTHKVKLMCTDKNYYCAFILEYVRSAKTSKFRSLQNNLFNRILRG